MIRLILVRHGRTEWSDTHYMGRQDVPLSQAGAADAEALAEVLAAEGPVAQIWSSPLQRARGTAAPLAERCGLPVTVVDELAEMDYGELQGVAKAERRIHIRPDHVTEPIPGGESLADVAARAHRVGQRLARDVADGHTVVLVGHYRVNQLLLGELEGRRFDDIVADPVHRPENTSAWAVTCRPGPDGALRADPGGRWLKG
ncbi:MAG: histidine phosphatase family protein [Acidimicrobiales bacterium]